MSREDLHPLIWRAVDRVQEVMTDARHEQSIWEQVDAISRVVFQIDYRRLSQIQYARRVAHFDHAYFALVKMGYLLAGTNKWDHTARGKVK